MLDKFWESLGDKVAERFATVSVPAVVFWLGGLLAWVSGRGGLNVLRQVARWADHQAALVQVVTLLAILLGILASGVVMQRLTSPVLRLLEGYWPRPFRSISASRTAGVRDKALLREKQYQALAEILDSGESSAQQRSEYIRLEDKLRLLPADGDYLPTKLGNILRAAERKPAEKYGLDAVVLWPRLWLLLPAETKAELSQARSSLDTSVGVVIWATLFFGFSFLAPWVPFVALAVALASYFFWVPDRAKVFGVLLEATFDVHRALVYENLRWPLPANPREERESGKLVTRYLLRGLDSETPEFTTLSDATSCEIQLGGRH